jgi:hypothetical protein
LPVIRLKTADNIPTKYGYIYFLIWEPYQKNINTFMK